MRILSILALAAIAFATSLTVATTEANAVVCAAGVHRAGCVTAGGTAVVTTRPVAACRYVVVNGVRVRRCV
jgi:hypothetical protein